MQKFAAKANPKPLYDFGKQLKTIIACAKLF